MVNPTVIIWEGQSQHLIYHLQGQSNPGCLSLLCVQWKQELLAEGKSHSPLYAAHSITEIWKLFLPPARLTLKSSLYFSFLQNKSEKPNLFQDKYRIHLRDPNSLLSSVKYLILQLHLLILLM